MNQQDLFAQLLQNASRVQPLQPQQPHLRIKIPLMQTHNYWRGKVMEVHTSWKKVPDTVDVGKLDKTSLSLEKRFKKNKMIKFKLGDRVRISASSKRVFKALHKKFGMWKEGMTELIGKEGVVMDLASSFAILVALIGNGESIQIHGFALDVVQHKISGVFWQNSTDFKVDDEVVIGVDVEVLAHLQKSSRRTPYMIAANLVGLIARVIAFRLGEVVVTFNEVTHEMFNPSALELYDRIRHKNQKKLTKYPNENSISSAKIPKIGSQVAVKTDLQKVMISQRGHGEWHYKMTKFLGKTGRVTEHIGGDIKVEFNLFESYRLNPQNVEDVKPKRQRSSSGSSKTLKPFAVGEVVRLNIDSADLFSHMRLMRIPLEYIILIHASAEFVGYADERRGVVNFGKDVEFVFELDLLTKVDEVMKEQHLKLWQFDKTIGVGKEVMLWVGPKNFAKSCIRSLKDGFEEALTERGKIEGYDDQGNAIIKYADGNMYSLPDEYLCSPREEWTRKPEGGGIPFYDWRNEPIKVPTALEPTDLRILHSITDVLESNDESAALKWKSTVMDDVKQDGARIIEVNFLAELDDHEKFLEKLKSKLASENLLHGALDNYLIAKDDQHIFKVQFNFETYKNLNEAPESENKNEYLSGQVAPSSLDRLLSMGDANDGSLTKEDSEVVEQKTEPAIIGNINDLPTLENLANPFVQGTHNIQIPAGVRQVVLQLGGSSAPPPPGIGIPQPRPDAGQLDNIIPAPSTVINMYGDGRNEINMNRCRVDTLTQS